MRMNQQRAQHVNSVTSWRERVKVRELFMGAGCEYFPFRPEFRGPGPSSVAQSQPQSGYEPAGWTQWPPSLPTLSRTGRTTSSILTHSPPSILTHSPSILSPASNWTSSGILLLVHKINVALWLYEVSSIKASLDRGILLYMYHSVTACVCLYISEAGNCRGSPETSPPPTRPQTSSLLWTGRCSLPRRSLRDKQPVLGRRDSQLAQTRRGEEEEGRRSERWSRPSTSTVISGVLPSCWGPATDSV